MNIKDEILKKIPEEYDFVSAQRQSNHPKDAHLFLVCGFDRQRGKYAVWEFSSITKELFAGEYELTKPQALSRLADRTKDVYTQFDTIDECNEAFKKFYGEPPLINFELPEESFEDRKAINEKVGGR